MKTAHMKFMPVVWMLSVFIFAACGGGGDDGGLIGDPGRDDPPDAVVQPLALPGPYAVACSNVAQDLTKLGVGEEVTDYWEGLPDGERTRYATDLLADPDNTLIANVTAPQDSTLFGSFAGQSLPFVVIVCYPTTQDNTRPDYPLLPTGPCRICMSVRRRLCLPRMRLSIRSWRIHMAIWAARYHPTITCGP
jgi:hypothetical protein